MKEKYKTRLEDKNKKCYYCTKHIVEGQKVTFLETFLEGKVKYLERVYFHFECYAVWLDSQVFRRSMESLKGASKIFNAITNKSGFDKEANFILEP